jgi:glutamate synthase domain-containing protein 3
MTGGELFVLREHAQRLGPTPLVAHDLDERDRARLRELLAQHTQRTGSRRARALLDEGSAGLDAFVRIAVVVPQPAAVPA